MPKVSIIIPVYNVERYLPECIASIIAQDFSDFECLLIDDGSTDGSGVLCDNYAVKDSRFRVFHQENQGVSAARNRGIAESTGEWIYFIDGDDWMMPGIFNEIDFRPDVVIGCYRRECDDYTYSIYHRITDTGNPALSYLKEDLRACIGSFMVKSSLLAKIGINFPLCYKYGEDMEFILKSLLCSSSVVIDSRCWMVYRINPKSAMSKPTLRRYDVFFSRLGLIDYAKECGNIEVSNFLKNIGCANTLLTVSKAIVREGGRIAPMVSFVTGNRVVREFLESSINCVSYVPDSIKKDLKKLRNNPLKFGIGVIISKINYEVRCRFGLIKIKILEAFK